MFYVLIIRPQQKRAKQQTSMLNTLEPGVEIVTIGGIYGTIVEAGAERLRIRVADGSEFEIARRAVGSIVPVSDELDDAIEDPDIETDSVESTPIASTDEPAGETSKND